MQIDVNGTSLFVEDTGPGSTGETIVFSHGLLWDTSLFAPQIAALRANYRCIAWDHRGQGRSAATIASASAWSSSRRMPSRCSRSSTPGRCTSWDCRWAASSRCASRRGARARAVADPARDLGGPRADRERRPLSHADAVVRVLGPRLVANRVAPIMLGQTILGDPNRRTDVATYTATMSQRKDIWRAVNGVIDRAPIYDELSRITAPTLVMVGDEDVATPPPEGRASASQRSQGHGSRSFRAQVTRPPSRNPARVTAGIANFLS